MAKTVSAAVSTANGLCAARRSLTILGATGSIGKSTLDLVERSPDAFEIVALTAQSNVAALAEAARRTRARLAVIGDPALYGELQSALTGTGIRAAAGPDAVIAAAAEPADCVMAAIVGAAGLEPTFEAARQGRRLALANKECLVSAGEVFMAAVADAGTELLPVDSEHSACLQALAGPLRKASSASCSPRPADRSGPGPSSSCGKPRPSRRCATRTGRWAPKYPSIPRP